MTRKCVGQTEPIYNTYTDVYMKIWNALNMMVHGGCWKVTKFAINIFNLAKT